MVPDFVCDIYDEPPTPMFWLVHLLSKGELWHHEAVRNGRFLVALAYADRHIKRLTERAKSGNTSDYDPDDY